MDTWLTLCAVQVSTLESLGLGIGYLTEYVTHNPNKFKPPPNPNVQVVEPFQDINPNWPQHLSHSKGPFLFKYMTSPQ